MGKGRLNQGRGKSFFIEHLQELEARGDFAAIVSLPRHQGKSFMALRLLVSQMRAHVAQGDFNEFYRNLQEWRRGWSRPALTELQASELKCWQCLALSLSLRRRGKLLASRRWLESAQRWAQLNGHSLLRAECEFSKGALDHGLGRLYDALLSFTRCQSYPELGVLKRELAMTNEAWIRWEIGDLLTLRKIIPKLNQTVRWRVKLAYLMLSGGTGEIREHLNQVEGHLQQIEFNELINLLILCLECELVLLKGDNINRWVKALPPSPLGKAICQMLNEEDAAHLSVSGGSDLESRNDQLDFAWLMLLHEALKNPREAYFKYRDQFSRQLWVHRVSSPLMIHCDELLERRTYWSQALLRHFKCDDFFTLNFSDSADCARLFSEEMSRNGTVAQELELTKSPIAVKLIRALSNLPDKTLWTRSELHHILSDHRYSSHLHDQRLYKMLSRLGERLQRCFGHKPWRFTGEGDLRVLIRFQNHNIPVMSAIAVNLARKEEEL